MGLPNDLSCEAESFSCCRLNPKGVFNQRSGALFPHAGTLGCSVCLAPQSFLPIYLHVNVRPLSLQTATSPSPPAASRHPPPCRESSLPRLLSPPLLPIWLNVSSLTPWLSDFHTVRFSVSSGVLFLNLLSFCLCEEAQCVYLRLHLGWKSISQFLT